MVEIWVVRRDACVEVVEIDRGKEVLRAGALSALAALAQLGEAVAGIEAGLRKGRCARHARHGLTKRGVTCGGGKERWTRGRGATVTYDPARQSVNNYIVFDPHTPFICTCAFHLRLRGR